MVSQNQRSASQLLMVTQSPLVMFIALNVLYFLFNVLNLFISKAFLCICLAIQQWFLDIFCCCLAVLLMFHTICFYLFSLLFFYLFSIILLVLVSSQKFLEIQKSITAGIFLLEVHNRNTGISCEIGLKLLASF